MTRILVSNDDGINHPSLWDLVRAIDDVGEVIVSAPDHNCSGVGTAMTLHNPVRASEVRGEIEGVKAHPVQGMPGDAVVLGLRELAEGPVDAVITGINPGNNVTTNVLISGTLGAAYAGHLNGVKAMAISVGYRVDTTQPLLKKVVRAAVDALLDHEGPALVNLNFPWKEDWPLKGARATYPAPRILEDHIRQQMDGDDRFYLIYRELVDGVDFDSLPDDCDVAALRAGYVSVNSMAWPVNADRDSALVDSIVASVKAAIS